MTPRRGDSVARGETGGWTGFRLAILLAIAVLAWLPGVLTLPALDRDESRFAQASRQMVESGNYIDIRLGDAPRYNKPIGIYWLQAGVVEAAKPFVANAEAVISFYRVPSLVSGFLALLLTFWIARAFASGEVAFAAAVLLGSTLLLAIESQIATTDAALLATILAAQGVLLRARLASERQVSLPIFLTLFGWAAVGLGILIKGPVVLAVTGVMALSLSVWDRDWRWLKTVRPVSGLALAITVAAPWAIAIGLASHGAFYQQSLGHDFAAKLAGGQESHGAPPGYYLVLLNLTFWPATLFLIPAIDLALRRRNEPFVRFLLAWALSSFAMFELVPTKLPHYILPAYPALAILAALWIAEDARAPATRWQKGFRYAACAQFALGTLALAAVPFVLPSRFGGSSPAWALSGAIAALLAGAGAVYLLLSGKRKTAMAFAAGSALVFYPVLVLGAAPQLQPLWISERVATLVARDGKRLDPPVVSAGYAEPSLLFALGGATKLTTGPGAASYGAAHGGIALVEDADRRAFLARLVALRASAAPIDQLSGFDYSRGRKEHITLYRMSRAPQTTALPGN